jgi:hypothetical protein
MCQTLDLPSKGGERSESSARTRLVAVQGTPTDRMEVERDQIFLDHDLNARLGAGKAMLLLNELDLHLEK